MKPGESLAQYEIISHLGTGGMGEVFRARDTILEREVALKILPEEWSEDPERLARFRREAKVLASLHHPNIASIFGLGEADGRIFLAMELVEGKDLAEILQDGPLPLELAVDIALQVATGLEEAHEKGFIHRDLKPANIKRTPDGRVKVLDFGLARALVDEQVNSGPLQNSPTITAAMTAQGVILGTAAYMSPEQARGQVVDARTDIWAFGCILLEMLTGRSFFAGETFSDTLASILKSDPAWADLPADLPRGALRLLRRCLAKNPRQRLHSIADARLELSDMSCEPDRPAAPPTGVKNPSRAGLWIALAAVMGLAAGSLVFRQLNPAPGAPQPARLDNLTFVGREWSPSASAEGDIVVFTSDRDGIARIWMKQVSGGGEVPLTDGPDDSPRFSPDGAQILFTRDDQGNRMLFRQTLVGGQPRKVLDDALEGDWSPDGQQVAFLRAIPESGDNTVMIGTFAMQTGKESILGSVEKRACYGIRWSPDGRTIAVQTSSLTGNVAEISGIHLFDVATGEVAYARPTSWTGPFSVLEWADDSKSFVVGQSAEVIAHVSGTPSIVMQYHLDTESTTPLFWVPLRLPKGSWTATTFALLRNGDIILDAQVEFSQLLEYQVQDQGLSQPRTLASGLSFDRQPVFSPDGKRLLFSSNRSGNIDIWGLDLERGTTHRLTDDPAGDWDPAFSPDGQSLLWSSDRSGNMEIWMGGLDGSAARQVSHDGIDAENPTMTPDARWIIYASSSDAKSGVWKVRPDGTDAEQLAAGSYLIPEVSPDGRYALFMLVHKLDFYVKVLEVETGRLLDWELDLKVTERDENLVFGRGRWTPDGKGILYIGQDESGNSGVYLTAFQPDGPWDGIRRKVAGFDPRFTTESLAMSPDGQKVVIAAVTERRTLQRASSVPWGVR